MTDESSERVEKERPVASHKFSPIFFFAVINLNYSLVRACVRACDASNSTSRSDAVHVYKRLGTFPNTGARRLFTRIAGSSQLT